MTLRMAFAGCLLVFLSACGDTPQEQVDAAQAALNGGDFAAARSTAEAALARDAVKADKGLSWRLEKLRLDALAGNRDGAEVLATLDRLQAAYPAQVDAALYAALTGKLSQSRDLTGAIDVADAGMKKFPEQKARFEAELANLKAAAVAASEGGDNAALERLRSLGYL